MLLELVCKDTELRAHARGPEDLLWISTKTSKGLLVPCVLI